MRCAFACTARETALSKRLSSEQEWEQQTEQTSSSEAFTEKTGTNLLEYTSVQSVQATANGCVTAPNRSSWSSN